MTDKSLVNDNWKQIRSDTWLENIEQTFLRESEEMNIFIMKKEKECAFVS